MEKVWWTKKIKREGRGSVQGTPYGDPRAKRKNQGGSSESFSPRQEIKKNRGRKEKMREIETNLEAL